VLLWHALAHNLKCMRGLNEVCGRAFRPNSGFDRCCGEAKLPGRKKNGATNVMAFADACRAVTTFCGNSRRQS
jgi:hypothetical protein